MIKLKRTIQIMQVFHVLLYANFLYQYANLYVNLYVDLPLFPPFLPYHSILYAIEQYGRIAYYSSSK